MAVPKRLNIRWNSKRPTKATTVALLAAAALDGKTVPRVQRQINAPLSTSLRDRRRNSALRLTTKQRPALDDEARARRLQRRHAPRTKGRGREGDEHTKKVETKGRGSERPKAERKGRGSAGDEGPQKVETKRRGGEIAPKVNTKGRGLDITQNGSKSNMGTKGRGGEIVPKVDTKWRGLDITQNGNKSNVGTEVRGGAIAQKWMQKGAVWKSPTVETSGRDWKNNRKWIQKRRSEKFTNK